MKQRTTLWVAVAVFLFSSVFFTVDAARYMENLDRGVVAVYKGSSQVYIGWRMFGTEPETVGFNIYRDSVKINGSPITGSTNYTDNSGSSGSTYQVASVIGGVEQDMSEPVAVWGQQYLTVPLQRPAGVTTPDAYTCTYSPNDASVGDLDGDGEYEIVLKWDPSNSHDNGSQDLGYSGNVYLDAYELDGTFLWRIDLGINIRAGAHYTQFMVYDLDSDGRAEVACKTAPYTKDGPGNYVLLPGDTLADYRNSDGMILEGPEYLTVFDGLTGAELDTVNYIVPRGNVCDWGDCYGNRVDRFLACVAYLDGQRPSLVMCRGYYTRSTLTAWDFHDGHLTQRWLFDSYDGTPGNSAYSGQGNHNISVGDVDGDGKDEIIYGGCAIDDDGTGLYSTGLGHGDAMHLGDLDPDRPGLEVFDIHEPSGADVIGSEFRDAATGEIIWSMTPGDVGRGCADDIYAGNPGGEMWASNTAGLRDRYGSYIGRTPSSTNFLAWWDGDLTRELLDSNHIDKYGLSSDTRLLTASGCSSNNGSKSTPCLSADILGDWREEVIWRTDDNQSLRIYTTTTVTSHRIYTLMHDPQYRVSIAWQNTAYNQPPHTGFFLGDGMSDPPVPDIVLVGTPSLYGDFTGDLRVDMDDLPYFVDLWLEDNCVLTAELDLNEDCLINFVEFSMFSGNWTPDTIPPLVPTGLSAAAGNETVSLDWNDNGEGDLDGYNVYRSTTSGSGYTLLNASLLSSSDYVDNDVTNGTTYYYVVTAVDMDSNESAQSSEASATPNLITTLRIQELEPGFVGVFDGIPDETTNGGYTGVGYANTDNAVGNYIEWTVEAAQDGTYDLQWRFANGTSTNRTATVSINDQTQATNVSFTGTGNWDTWDVTAIVTVPLVEGTNTIRLIAETNDGLANIDWMEVTGIFP